jgi:hypothetical protein
MKLGSAFRRLPYETLHSYSPAELPTRDRFGLRRLRHGAPEGVLCRECFTRGRLGSAQLPSA